MQLAADKNFGLAVLLKRQNKFESLSSIESRVVEKLMYLQVFDGRQKKKAKSRTAKVSIQLVFENSFKK